VARRRDRGTDSRISDDGHLTLYEHGVSAAQAWLLERI
jgi:hypothetical protein